MTDQELIRKLLKRNHMLTARVRILAARVEELEMTRPPVDVLNEGMSCHHRMLEALRDAINLQGAAIHTICENMEPPINSTEVFEIAEQINNEIKLENAFEGPPADREEEG
jgi:hypothetical protein